MRKTAISAVLLCLLVVAPAVPCTAQSTTAQSGKQKHRAADTAQTAKPDQTLKSGQTAGSALTFTSDAMPPTDQMLKSGTTVSSSETPAQETMSIRHVPAFYYGPIDLKWEFNDKRGFAELVLVPDGNWELKGSFDNTEPKKDLDIVFALRDKNGAVFIFHRVAKAPKGKHPWGGSHPDLNVANIYPVLSEGFDVRAAYRLPTTAEGTAEQKPPTREGHCETTATMAAGWAPIWTWVAPHECYQFNSTY